MKKLIVLLISLNTVFTSNVSAQSIEVQQLLLNVEKLAQFKQILSDLKRGYEIVSQGYSTIKDLSQGNFNLHKTFLDGLLQVSPNVRKYKRIADIINNQLLLVKEYKNAFKRFKQDKNFNPQEIEYLGKVYTNLLQRSFDDLDELLTLITDHELRMSDDERIEAINRVFHNMQDKLLFLRHFNNKTTILALQRAKDKNDVATVRTLYGITK